MIQNRSRSNEKWFLERTNISPESIGQQPKLIQNLVRKSFKNRFLEPCWLKMSPRIDFSWIFHPFWGSKMQQKSIQKPSNFQTSLETLFSANRVHKSSKMRVQNHSKIEPFLGRVKNRESCSRLHADLVFEVWRAPKPHFFRDHFRKPSSCCTGTLVFQIFDKIDAPESVQNRSKILFKMNQKNKMKKQCKIRGGPRKKSAAKAQTLVATW